MSEFDFDEEYASLTEIGKQAFDVSSHVCGRWVADEGLRVVGGDPTEKAKKLGLVKRVPTGRGEGDYWIWHRAKTIKLLEQAGHQPVQWGSSNQKEAAKTHHPLVGPFSHKLSATDTYLLANGNGETFGWMVNETAATFTAKMLNLADKYGKLPPQG